MQADTVGTARLRYLGTSAQKTRLVVDLIRGLDVARAIATLRHTKKVVAADIGRLLDSAVANARQKREHLDVDRLFVATVFVDGGPSLKRIRPAPMGRAFRVQKRTCHVTVGLGERAEPARPAAAATGTPAAAAGGKQARRAAAVSSRARRRRAAGGGGKAAGKAATKGGRTRKS